MAARLAGPTQVSARSVLTACGVGLLFFALLYAMVRAPLADFATGTAVILALALDHPVRWLQRHYVPRLLAIGLVLLGATGLIAALCWLVVPAIVDQGRELAAQSTVLLDRLAQSPLVRRWIDVDALVDQLRHRLSSRTGQVAAHALAAADQVLRMTATAVAIGLITLFCLLYGRELLRAAVGLVRPARRSAVEHALRNVYRSAGLYVIGLFGICAINAAVTCCFLAILEIPYFLPFGVAAGAASMIPFVGVTLIALLIGAVSWAAKGIWYGLAVLVYFVTYQQLENHAIAPLVYRRTIEVNPLLSLVALLFSTELLGVGGAILAVPSLAIVQVLTREIVGATRAGRAQAHPAGAAGPP